MKKKINALVLTSNGEESKLPPMVLDDSSQSGYLITVESRPVMAVLCSISNKGNFLQRKSHISLNGICEELIHGLKLIKPLKKNIPGCGSAMFSSRNTNQKFGCE